MKMTEEMKAARRAYDRAYYASHKEQAAERKRRYWERKAARLAAEKAAMEIDTQNEPEKK